MQNNLSASTTSTQTDAQVTTVVQQIDAQGPVVIDRISTQFADLACSRENVRSIVEALHNGTSVTLNANGKTATFTAPAHLGYGEAYIALALAAEELRQAGVTSCATPDQWQAVLVGGPINVTGTTRITTSTGSNNFPGILTLHSQGQGWGQIAQTTHVQLGQVVSSARSSMNLSSANASNSSNSSLAPTGQSSSEMQSSRFPNRDKNDSTSSGLQSDTDRPLSTGKDKDKDDDHDDNASKDRSNRSSDLDSSSSSTSPSTSSGNSSSASGSNPSSTK
jgi:hypothetical protein